MGSWGALLSLSVDKETQSYEDFHLLLPACPFTLSPGWERAATAISDHQPYVGWTAPPFSHALILSKTLGLLNGNEGCSCGCCWGAESTVPSSSSHTKSILPLLDAYLWSDVTLSY